MPSPAYVMLKAFYLIAFCPESPKAALGQWREASQSAGPSVKRMIFSKTGTKRDESGEKKKTNLTKGGLRMTTKGILTMPRSTVKKQVTVSTKGTRLERKTLS